MLVLMLVLIVELINSAIEAVVDRVSLDSNPLSGLRSYRGRATRHRRALTVLEIQQLLEAARLRPLHNRLHQKNLAPVPYRLYTYSGRPTRHSLLW